MTKTKTMTKIKGAHVRTACERIVERTADGEPLYKEGPSLYAQDVKWLRGESWRWGANYCPHADLWSEFLKKVAERLRDHYPDRGEKSSQAPAQEDFSPEAGRPVVIPGQDPPPEEGPPSGT